MSRQATRRTRRFVIGVVVLVTLQAIAILVYRRVERDGLPPRAVFPTERIALDGAELDLERSNGAQWSLRELRGRRVVLHFWATWCGPCRTELPTLIAQAARIRRAGLELVLVSVDDDWPAIDSYFGGKPPPEVVRATTAAYRQITTGVLPETLLLDPNGRPEIRVRGARNWGSTEAMAFLEGSR